MTRAFEALLAYITLRDTATAYLAAKGHLTITLRAKPTTRTTTPPSRTQTALPKDIRL